MPREGQLYLASKPPIQFLPEATVKDERCVRLQLLLALFGYGGILIFCMVLLIIYG